MNKMLRIGTILFLLIVFLFSGCAANTPVIQENNGLFVGSLSTALGAADDDSLDETLFSFDINLTNNEESDVFISTAEVIVNEAVANRLKSKLEPIELNKALKPGETIAIQGELAFETKGMSKEEIVKLEPFITDLKVTREQSINLLRKEGP